MHLPDLLDALEVSERRAVSLVFVDGVSTADAAGRLDLDGRGMAALLTSACRRVTGLVMAGAEIGD